MRQDIFNQISSSGEWLRVKSAFGGLALYRWNAVKELRYMLEVNSDNEVEVYCEHRSLYKQMVARGYDKIYINPRMKLRYPFVNWSIISGFIKRRIANIRHPRSGLR